MNKKLKRKAFIYSAEGSHDPSQIILIFLFAAQETFLIIINVEKKVMVCSLIYAETMIYNHSNVWCVCVLFNRKYSFYLANKHYIYKIKNIYNVAKNKFQINDVILNWTSKNHQIVSRKY